MSTQKGFTKEEIRLLQKNGYTIEDNRIAINGEYGKVHTKQITKLKNFNLYPIELYYWEFAYDTEHDRYVGGNVSCCKSIKEAIKHRHTITY